MSEQLGKIAYEAYAANTGWKSLVTNQPLPKWEALYQPIQEAWGVAAAAVRSASNCDASLCAGDRTLRTADGRSFNLDTADPEAISLEVIAHALSRLTRFGGHVLPQHYSVAEHSINCLLLAQQLGYTVPEQRAVLMHDAAEAYLGDMIRPLKILMPEFQVYEAKLTKLIGERFDIAFDRHEDAIKLVDNRMLVTEKNAVLALPHTYKFNSEDKYPPIEGFRPECYLPGEAKGMFMQFAYQLAIK